MACQLESRGRIRAREEQEGRFYSASVPVRIPLRVAARRSTRAERRSEVCSTFSLWSITSVNPTFSRSSPRRILAIIDWDFGGSHALPFADQAFEPSWPDSDETDDVREKQAEEAYNSQLLIDKLAGTLPYDTQLIRLVYSTRWDILDREAPKASGKDPSARLDDSGVKVVGSVPDDTEA